MWLRPNLLLFLLPSAFRLQSARAFSHNLVYKQSNYSSRSVRLTDNMSDLEGTREYPIFWYDEVTSTMDKARELCTSQKGYMFAVAAQAQTKGRGTRGRDWLSAQNNLMLTVAIRRNSLPIPLMLLPLRIGTIIGSCMARRITTDVQLKLKWPNDILIDSKKACGVLIEMEDDMLLVGIGCNVMHAPIVNSVTNSAAASPLIRPATCLAEHNPQIAQAGTELAAKLQIDVRSVSPETLAETTIGTESTGATTMSADRVPNNIQLPLTLAEGDYHKELALEICDNLSDWLLSRSDTAALVLSDFTANMDYSPQRLRDEPNPALGTVVPIGLNPDGTLKVKYAHNDEEGYLAAEYLW